MKKIALLVVLLFFVPDVQAEAAIKVGSACKSLGATAELKSRKLTCIKTGKKKIWSTQTRSIEKPAVSTTTPAKPTTPPAKPTTFNDLLEKSEGIPGAIWEDTRKLISAGSVKSPLTNLYVGPESVVTNKQIEDDYIVGSKLWSNFKQPKSFSAAYYGRKDVAWVKKKILESTGIALNQEVDMNCNIQQCAGANANAGGIPLLLFGADAENVEPYYVNGGIEIHEFTHMVQWSQFDYNFKAIDDARSQAPCWFIEGQAHLAGISGAASSYSEYQTTRARWFNSTPLGLVDGFETDSILKFLNSGCVDTHGHVYDVGLFAVEALSSIKGIEASMDVLRLMAKGESFNNAFEVTYGLSVDKSWPIIASVVSKQFKAAR